MSDDPAPNASPDGRNTPLSKAEVYVAEDGRPGLLLKRKNLGADGWEVAMVKAGMVVTGWLSSDDLAQGRKWKPVLPQDAFEKIEALEQRVNVQALDRDALLRALRTAVNLLPPEQAEQVRTVYARSRPE